MKLQSKIIALYAIATLFLSMGLLAFFYTQIWKTRLDSIQVDISHQLNNVDFVLDEFFRNVKGDVENLSENPLVRTREDAAFTSFLDADEKTFMYDISKQEQEIIDLFAAYQRTHPHVNSVYMGRENGSFVRSFKRERPTRYDPRKRPWYISAMQSPLQTVLTEAYPSVTTNDINIGIVRTLLDSTGKPFGVIGADVTLTKLTNFISAYITSPPGKILLIDTKGMVLAGLEEDLLLQRLDLYAGDLYSALMASDEGMYDGLVNGKEVYAFFRTSAQYRWKTVVVIPKKNIEFSLIGQIMLTSLGIGLSLLLLSVITIIGLQFYIVRPLREFIQETNYIADTVNLERSIDINSCEEMGALAVSFNKMIRKIGSAYTNLINAKIELLRHKNTLEAVVNERTIELQSLNQSLTREIGERAETFKQLEIAKDRAEESDRLKTSFLATMSHELRTPLNSIIGLTEIVLQGINGGLNEKQRKQILQVKESGNQLLSLVNDVIDIAKIEAGQLDIAEKVFSLKRAIEIIIEEEQPFAAKKGLALLCSIAPELGEIYGDQHRFAQIVSILIGNAIKFTESGTVTVRVSVQRESLCIEVIDTGIGMKIEDMEYLFKPFRQIDAGISRQYEGSGLGLSLCKKLVEHMGGRVRATSISGEGSTFTVCLPLNKESDTAPHS